MGVERPSGAPLVGRVQELSLLRDTLARVVREREPQLVTLVGVPGIGKSRLVFELFQELERDPELVYWRLRPLAALRRGGDVLGARRDRQGARRDPRVGHARSRPRRSCAEPSRRSSPSRAEASLGGAAPAAARGSRDRGRRRRRPPQRGVRRLAPLPRGARRAAPARARVRGSALGRRRAARLRRPPRSTGRAASRSSCWRRRAPSCSRAGRAGAAARSTRRRSCCRRSPTPRRRRCSHGLLGRSVLPAEAQAHAARAGGREPALRRGVRAHADRPSAIEVALPESVQGIIAARLDSLPGEEKELLQDAAVVGRVFWLGALGQRAVEARGALALARAQGVRAPRAPELGRRRGRVRLQPRARARRGLRADPDDRSAPTSTARPPSGSSRSAAPKTTPRCWPTTTCRRSSTPEAAGEPTNELADEGRSRRVAGGRRPRALAERLPGRHPLLRARAGDRPRRGGDERTRCELLLSLGDAQARAGDMPAAQGDVPGGRRPRRAASARRSSSPAPRSATAAGSSGSSRGTTSTSCRCSRRRWRSWGEDSGLRVSCSPGWRPARFVTEGRSRPRGAVLGARRSRWPAASGTRRPWSTPSPATSPPAFARVRPEQVKLWVELVRTAIEAGEKERAFEGQETRLAAPLELGDLQAA